ncbi:MAG: carboxypeptidase-like regulatory domain-containing protein, partial [Gemmatimonadota bacterium]|nr:carboxypeptidase-like regulatory domain-containing protein [Gemmatimonadota bacterium]
MLQLCKLHAKRALSAAFFLFVSTAAAQSTTGALGGRVSTTDGTAIPEATITVVHIPTGARYTAHTDAQGRYLLPNLKPGGPYAVAVRHLGLQPAGRDDISVTLGTTSHFNFAMEPTAVALTAVTVNGDLADEMSTR